MGAVQHVRETAVQPGLVRHVVSLAVNRLGQDVGEAPAESGDFLLQPGARSLHKIVVTILSELIPMRQRTWHSAARRLQCMLPYDLRIKGRQLMVPVHNRSTNVRFPRRRSILTVSRFLCH